MIRLAIASGICLALAAGFTALGQTKTSEPRSGPYLGEAPPGDSPKLFAPGIVARGFHEHGIAFSDDGNEIYWIVADRNYQNHIPIVVKQLDGEWQTPEIASYASATKDMAPSISPDGKRLFFSSDRANPDDPGTDYTLDLWVADRLDSTWSAPIRLGSHVNTEAREAQPSVAADGTLYFQAMRGEGRAFDIYFARFENGAYGPAQPMPEGVNTDSNEAAPFIAPDGSYLLFQSNRPGTLGAMDIYATFRKPDGGWTEPANLGAPVNSSASEFQARVSPDGKYLFFSSYRGLDSESLAKADYEELTEMLEGPGNGNGTIYWVDAAILDRVKKTRMD